MMDDGTKTALDDLNARLDGLDARLGIDTDPKPPQLTDRERAMIACEAEVDELRKQCAASPREGRLLMMFAAAKKRLAALRTRS